MNELKEIALDLWSVTMHSKFMLFHVGTRMTVIRLNNGELMLYSPVTITSSLKQEIDQLGKVAHIVCPNSFHHMYAGQALSIYPNAMLHGPANLHKKRKDLPFNAELNETAHKDWQGQLIPLTINGSLMHETVFFHAASKTLLTCDLVENFETSPHLLTRIWLKLGGCHGRISWPRILRLVYINRRAARKSVEKLFDFPFERVILAHGDIIEEDAKAKLKSGLSWLL